MGNCKSDASGTRCKKNGNRKVTLALFGLDNAGKTVTAKGFLGEEVETPTPTIGFSSVDFQHGRHNVTMFDLGGGKNIRGIWKNYFAEIHGAIFVIDASAPTRLDECRKALADILQDEMIRGKPLLLLANKQDVSGAMDEMDLCDRLQLEDLVNAHKTPCRVESCSAALRKDRKNPKMDKSINDGFSWLMELVDEKWNELNGRVKRDIERKEARERQEKVERAERVRKSRELREKEEKSNGHLNEDAKEDREEKGDAGDPFKPIKHQLETSLKMIEEKKKSREQKARQNGVGGEVSSKSYPESKSMENVSWKPPTTSKRSSNHDEDITKRPSARSNHRSDSEEDVARSRSNGRLDLDDKVDQRPSPRSRSGLDKERSTTRSKHRSDDENDEPRSKSTSNQRTGFDEERMEVRRLKNEPLKPISPTRITGLKNGSDDSVTEEEDRSVSIYPPRTSKTRILTPPVPLLRASEAEGHRKWNGHSSAGNMAINNDKNKKKKKARFNQTSPIMDSPEPHSSWRNTYSASTDGDRFHFFHSPPAYPDKGQDRVSRTPLLQRLVEAKAAEESNLKRRTKLSDDEDDDDDEVRPRTNTRDTYSNRRPTSSVHSTRKPNSHNYKSDDDDDDSDDIVV